MEFAIAFCNRGLLTSLYYYLHQSRLLLLPGSPGEDKDLLLIFYSSACIYGCQNLLEHSWKEKKVLELSAREDQFWIGQDQSVLIPLASPLDLIYVKFLVVSRWYFISWLIMMMMLMMMMMRMMMMMPLTNNEESGHNLSFLISCLIIYKYMMMIPARIMNIE